MDNMHIVIKKNNLVEIKSIGDVVIARTTTLDAFFEAMKDALDSGTSISPDLPISTVKYMSSGSRHVVAIVHHEPVRRYQYHDTAYNETPFPKLLFIITVEGNTIVNVKAAAVKDTLIRSTTNLYRFPYAHVNFDLSICFGQNSLPQINDLTQLSSIPELFLSMPAGDDLYSNCNRTGLALRELLEKSQGKPFDNSILLETPYTLGSLF